MGLKEGTTAFLKLLEDFEPPWRQAVLLANPGSGKKLIFAVRVTATETRSAESSGFSFFECSGEKFMLVEGQQSQIRNNCPRELRGLEVAPQRIFAAGKETLEQSPDLQYATASEELPPDIPTTRARGARTRLEESSEEDTEQEDEAGSEGDVFKMLQKARKLGAERDSSSGKDRRGRPTKSRSRYQLFEEKATSSQRKKASTSGLEALLQQNIAAGSNALSPENVNLMAQMELLKALKGKSKKEKLSSAQGDQDDSDCSSLESSSSHGKRGGASRALREYRRGHREMRRNPKKHIRRYIKEVEHHLGATKDTPYWGKQRSLLRIHHAASEVLQTLLQNKPELAALELVQLLRAIHQTCLDQGSWKASWLLLRYQDPVDVLRFGGEPQDLERVAGYMDALQKLEKRSKGLGKGDVADEEGGKGKKGKGNTQKQSGEKDE